MRHKKLKIALISLAAVLAVSYAGYRIATWYVVKKIQSVLTDDKLKQIDDFFKEFDIDTIMEGIASSDGTGGNTEDNTEGNTENSIGNITGDDESNAPGTSTPGSGTSGGSVTSGNGTSGGGISGSNGNSGDIAAPDSQESESTVQPGQGSGNQSSGNQGSGNQSSSNANSSQESSIDKIRNSATISDQLTGVQLVMKADINKILEMTKPGLNSEVKEELRTYMNGIYTQDEIKTIYELYSKYKHLLVQ